ncbi:DUF937 domain-containing protein [Limoniibacter endophyticus]|nr:DUF937 domain-containing protein [Limoniibacter endophyticus]
MFSLSDLIIKADGGKNVQQISQQYGLSQGETQQVIEAVLPALSQGLARNAASPQGAANFLEALSDGKHAKYFDDPAQALSAQGKAEGNGILGHLFGSKDLSRAVAAEASKATGIDANIIKQLLPALAAMVMGGLFKQSTGQVQGASAGQDGGILGQIFEQISAGQGRAGGGGGLGDILGSILGGGSAAPSSSRGGGGLGDLLGGLLQGAGAGRAPSQNGSAPRPGGDNALGNIFDSFLGSKGGAATGAAQQPEYHQPDSHAPSGQTSQSAPDNPLGEILGKMFQPGTTGTQSNSNVDTGDVMKSIFDQFMKR